MNLRYNLGLLYYLAPHMRVVKNRWGFCLSILLGFSSYKVKIDQGKTISFEKKQFSILLSLLGILSYATEYSIISKNKIKVSFDSKNWFTLSLTDFSKEDENLLILLYQGIKNGANFITEGDITNRKKTLKIIDFDGKKIVETFSGIKFFLELIHPGNTIIETFINDIHSITFKDSWEDKTVIDIGAECGDTALYYANLGAKVYSFEPIKSNFDALEKNLKLNPDLAKKITPFNAAIGTDGKAKFFLNPEAPDTGASFVYNKYDSSALTTIVDGYSLKSALKKFNIDKVDLLKMDCKGCEFFLTKEDLVDVEKVKIEYLAKGDGKQLDNLLNILEVSGFENVIYKVNPEQNNSNKILGHIFGEKKNHN